MPTVEANPKDIELFVRSVFRYADEGFVSLRTFHDQDQGKPPAKITAVAIEGGLDGLAKAAARDALQRIAGMPSWAAYSTF